MPQPDQSSSSGGVTGCPSLPGNLCLGERFDVSVDWQDFDGATGPGTAFEISRDSGAFWFFDEDNLELMVKVLDGTAVNGAQWVFYGALSNVEFTGTVTDTETGDSKVYRNPLGTFASVGDTEAFGSPER